MMRPASVASLMIISFLYLLALAGCRSPVASSQISRHGEAERLAGQDDAGDPFADPAVLELREVLRSLKLANVQKHIKAGNVIPRGHPHMMTSDLVRMVTTVINYDTAYGCSFSVPFADVDNVAFINRRELRSFVGDVMSQTAYDRIMEMNLLGALSLAATLYDLVVLLDGNTIVLRSQRVMTSGGGEVLHLPYMDEFHESE